MGIGREASPKGVGRFLLWVFIAMVIALVIFAIVFYSQGHKASLMRNSQISVPVMGTLT